MNSKESEMKGRREERNVLDELLDHHDDDEIDAELSKSDKKFRNQKKHKLDSNKESQHSVRYGNNSNGNGKRIARPDSPCSEYSSHSGSCSCEDHSSIASDSQSETGSQRSYQSFTRSPSLKIKIHKNSDSRTVRNLKSPPRSHVMSTKLYDDRDKYKDKPRKKESSLKKRDYRSLLKYFFKDSCYFVIKSNNPENIYISKKEKAWSTPLQNEIKLNSAFKEFRNVILIFSVKESGRFQGFARLASGANYDCEPVKWVLPPGLNSCPFGGVFDLDWICKNELSFNKTSHLFNPFNEGKPVKIARDGQEIDPRVGEELCRLFPSDDSVDLIPLLKRMKKQTSNRPKKRHTRGPFMEFDRPLQSRNNSQIRSNSSSEYLPPIKKRLGNNGLTSIIHSNRLGRDGRISSGIDRSRISPPPSRRDQPSINGNNYRLSYSAHSLDRGYETQRRSRTLSNNYRSDRQREHSRY